MTSRDTMHAQTVYAELNILVGVLGAFLGGLIFNLLGFDNTNITNNVCNLGSLAGPTHLNSALHSV